MDAQTIRISSIILHRNMGHITYGWQVCLAPDLVDAFGKGVSLSRGRLTLSDDYGSAGGIRRMNRPPKATMYFASFPARFLPDWPAPSMGMRNLGSILLKLRKVVDGTFDFDFDRFTAWTRTEAGEEHDQLPPGTDKLTMGVRSVVRAGAAGGHPRMGWQMCLSPELIAEFGGERRVSVSYGRVVIGDPNGILLNRSLLARRFRGSFVMDRLRGWPVEPTMDIRNRGTVYVNLRQTSTSGEFSFDTAELSPLFGPSRPQSPAPIPRSSAPGTVLEAIGGGLSLDEVRAAVQMLNEVLSSNPDVSVRVEDGRVLARVRRVVVSEEDL